MGVREWLLAIGWEGSGEGIFRGIVTKLWVLGSCCGGLECAGWRHDTDLVHGKFLSVADGGGVFAGGR